MGCSDRLLCYSNTCYASEKIKKYYASKMYVRDMPIKSAIIIDNQDLKRVKMMIKNTCFTE